MAPNKSALCYSPQYKIPTLQNFLLQMHKLNSLIVRLLTVFSINTIIHSVFLPWTITIGWQTCAEPIDIVRNVNFASENRCR